MNSLKIHQQVPVLEDILGRWETLLGSDCTSYKNHCYRVLNFCMGLADEEVEAMSKVAIAVAFHDLGIWTNGTFDYIGPSRLLAREHLARSNRRAWSEEIEAMIEQHHKIGKYKVHPDWLVEPFRKADWVDVSRGVLRFGLPSAFVEEVLSAFPNAGFHRRLVALTLQRFKTHPLSPLPMMRL